MLNNLPYKHYKQGLAMKTFALGLFTSLAVTLTGCVSTTSMGTVGADRKQLMVIPESAWNKVADRSFKQFENKAKSKSVYVIDPRLDKIMAKLVPHANQYTREHKKPIQWKINANLNSKPNAQSFPSGQIIVNTSIYMFEDLTDDELATLIAHEMAHVLRSHSREKASIYTTTNVGLMTATMGVGTAVGLASGLSGNYGVYMPHSRQLEQEADLIGLDIMTRAGFNPNASLSFWEKFEANVKSKKLDAKIPTFLSSHPSNENRKEMLAQQIQFNQMNSNAVFSAKK